MIHPNFNWKQFFMLNNALLTWNQSVQISEEMLNEVLESMRLTGQIVACEIGVSFKNAFSLRLRTKSQFVDFIHNACTQKPPENWSEAIYNWWCQTVPQLRQTIQESLADATRRHPHARRRRARHSTLLSIRCARRSSTLTVSTSRGSGWRLWSRWHRRNNTRCGRPLASDVRYGQGI